MYLSEEQIVNLIIEYILDKRYTQAILMEGDWGSGKTFFVQGKLLDELSKRIGRKTEHNQKIIYTSLYGIENLQQVMNEIYASLMESFFDEKIHEGSGETIGKGINFISKIASAGLKHFNVDTKDLSKITELKKLKNAVLIFDDLERCTISINQIFGFINNLVEHNDIKVIIVANQAEIGKMELTKDLAQKYSVVLNKNLSLQNDGEKRKRENNNQEKKQDICINKDELIKYTEQLFSNDILYEKIKEKLIGVTIYYRSNLHSIYESILQKYIVDENVRSFLSAKKEVVLNIFENKKHYNIRTMIFAIMAFEKIAILIKEIEFQPTKYIDEQQENILKYCITLSIHLKLGKKPYSWENNNIKAGSISLDDKYLFGEYILGYKFIDDYLLYRSFNRQEIKELLIQLMEDSKKNDEYKTSQSSLSYNYMGAWWELEDEEIEKKLRLILQELKEEKYHPRFFKSIIITLMQLKHNGFETIIYTDYVSKMELYFEKIEVDFNQENLEVLSDDKEFLDEYNKIISSLIDVLDRKKEEQKEVINNCLSIAEAWGEEFYEYCYNHKKEILQDKKFFFHLNVQKVIKRIEKSTIKDLYGLLSGINEIYNFCNLNEFFKADINNLMKMIGALDVEHLSAGKITKRIALVKLKNKLEESLKLIKQ